MASSTADTAPSGIAILAAGPADHFSPEDSPWRVHGVAISEDAVTVGQSEERRFWPRSTLQNAAERDLLVGRSIVKNFHDLEGQAPADDVIGEVTAVGYAEDIGLVFEGEIADREIAAKIDAGYLDVSPVPFIAEEDPDDTREAMRVERIARFRDLAVVDEGAIEGNEINMGPNPAVAALSAEALASTAAFAVDALQRDRARRPTYSDTEDAEWSTPSLDDYLNGYDSLPSPDEAASVDGLTDEDRSLIAEKSLLGTPDGETLREVRFFPVVNPATDALNSRALGAVRSGRGEQADIPSDARASAQRMAGELLNEEFDAEVDVEATSPGGDDGPGGSSGQSTPASWRTTMSDDLTDKERELLAAAGQKDDPVVVEAGVPETLSDYEGLIDAADGMDDPTVVSENEYGALQDRLDAVRDVFAEALQEQTGLSDAAIEAMPFEAMAAEFETDDGDIDIEALTQDPEAGGSPSDPDPPEFDPDALQTDVDASDRDEAVEILQQRYDQYSAAGWGHADALAADLETLGVEVS